MGTLRCSAILFAWLPNWTNPIQLALSERMTPRKPRFSQRRHPNLFHSCWPFSYSTIPKNQIDLPLRRELYNHFWRSLTTPIFTIPLSPRIPNRPNRPNDDHLPGQRGDFHHGFPVGRRDPRVGDVIQVLQHPNDSHLDDQPAESSEDWRLREVFWPRFAFGPSGWFKMRRWSAWLMFLGAWSLKNPCLSVGPSYMVVLTAFAVPVGAAVDMLLGMSVGDVVGTPVDAAVVMTKLVPNSMMLVWVIVMVLVLVWLAVLLVLVFVMLVCVSVVVMLVMVLVTDVMVTVWEVLVTVLVAVVMVTDVKLWVVVVVVMQQGSAQTVAQPGTVMTPVSGLQTQKNHSKRSGGFTRPKENLLNHMFMISVLEFSIRKQSASTCHPSFCKAFASCDT